MNRLRIGLSVAVVALVAAEATIGAGLGIERTGAHAAIGALGAVLLVAVAAILLRLPRRVGRVKR